MPGLPPGFLFVGHCKSLGFICLFFTVLARMIKLKNKWGFIMKKSIAGLQWMAFMVAGTIVAPIAIANLFGLSPEESAGFVQRTMFILGISSLLQGLFGHRLPINEGPAGLWWGVFALYGGLSATLFSSEMETLRALEGAMIISGVVFILLAIGNLIHKLAKLFTPVVLGTYLLLLVLQLSNSFINGMFGVGYRKEGVDIPIAIFSIALVMLTFYLSRRKNAVISQYSILISLIVGWFFFYVLGFMVPVEQNIDKLVKLPELFAFGPPIFDLGMSITAIFVTLLLLTNMVASIQLVGKVVEKRAEVQRNEKARYKRSGLVAGINHLLGGAYSAIGSVPISGAAGFIATTRNNSICPFIIGASFVTISSFSPHLMGLFASLPVPVGYSVMFVVFANMIGMAFSEFDQEAEKERVSFVIGLSLLSGVGVMFIPSQAFQGAPAIFTSIMSNGLIVGSMVAIILDRCTKRSPRKRRK